MMDDKALEEKAAAAAARVEDWAGADHFEDCPASPHENHDCSCPDTIEGEDACANLVETACDCYLGAMRDCRASILDLRALLDSEARLKAALKRIAAGVHLCTIDLQVIARAALGGEGGEVSELSDGADYKVLWQQMQGRAEAAEARLAEAEEMFREENRDALEQEARAIRAEAELERLRGALRDLLRDVDARLSLDSGYKGMGHNIAVESAGKLRVDAEYARRVLRDLSGEGEK